MSTTEKILRRLQNLKALHQQGLNEALVIEKMLLKTEKPQKNKFVEITNKRNINFFKQNKTPNHAILNNNTN